MRTTDLTLRDDIRFLGRLLGDTLREQEGEKTFALVEEIRQLSVAFRRHADAKAGKRLNRLLNRLSAEEAVQYGMIDQVITNRVDAEATAALASTK